VATAADFILDLQRAAAAVGLDAPPEGWRAWAAAVRAASQGDAPDDAAAGGRRAGAGVQRVGSVRATRPTTPRQVGGVQLPGCRG